MALNPKGRKGIGRIRGLNVFGQRPQGQPQPPGPQIDIPLTPPGGGPPAPPPTSLGKPGGYFGGGGLKLKPITAPGGPYTPPTPTPDPSITGAKGFKTMLPPTVRPPATGTQAGTYLPELVNPVLTGIEARGGLPADVPYSDLSVVFAPVIAKMNTHILWVGRIANELGLPRDFYIPPSQHGFGPNSHRPGRFKYEHYSRMFYDRLADYIRKNYRDVAFPKGPGPTTPTGGAMG